MNFKRIKLCLIAFIITTIASSYTNAVEIKAISGDFMINPPASSFNIASSFRVPTGSASYLDSTRSNVAVITDNAMNLTGAVWSNGRMDLRQSFTYDSFLYWGRSQSAPMGSFAGQTGGDGMTFTLHNDPRGTNTIGGRGGALGSYLRPNEAVTPIRNAISFEIDPFVNNSVGDFDEGMTVNTTTPNLSRHMAFVNPENPLGASQHTATTSFQTFGNIENQWVSFRAVWTPSGANGTLAITINGVTRSTTITNYTTRFNGTFAYLGYTGGTGGVTALQAVAVTELPTFNYNLSFNLNGASGTTPATQVVPQNGLATAVANPTRSGFIFNGWNTASNGTGTNWNFATSRMPGNAVTLFAQWVPRAAPQLSVPAFSEIGLNSQFNPLTGVSATDSVDGNLIADVIVTGSVDTATAGVYILNYSVTNSDNNTVTAKQVVLVNDGSFITGTNYILQAKDFSKRISEVDTSDSAIKNAAAVAVYEKVTGNASSATVNIVDDGGYAASVGSYTIQFEVANETTTTKTITATVGAGDAPVLTVPSFTEINVNGAFNPLTGVSASDTEDGNITGSVQVSGSVNTAVAGVYVLTYAVTDSDGNSTTAKQVVLVNDGTYVAGTTYILQAADFTKRVSEVDTAPTAIKTAAGVKVYVKATGSVSSETVNIVDADGYSATVGSYDITFEVANETTTAKTITASVITGDTPVLSAPAFTEINVNGAFNPLTGVSASDTEDGNITGAIQVSGSVNTAVAGVYVLTYTVTDSDGNSATAKQVVLVNDGTYIAGTTYILQARDFTKRVSEVDTAPSAIKTAAGVTVYEKATGSLSSEMVNIVDDGGYSATVGSYDITFDVASDSAATQTITATVGAGDAPVLTVPNFTEINVNGAFNPLTGVSASDTEDGNITGSVQVSGSVNTAVAGVYVLTYAVTDSDGNSTTAKQVVLVNDGTYVAGTTYILQAADFTKRVSEVDTAPSAIKTAAGVKVYEKATGTVSSETVNIVDDGGYASNVGTYTIQFEVANETTTTQTITATVSAGDAPVLTVPSFTEINVNGAFNPLTGVSATDTEDGSITGAVQVSGSVNTAVAGVYVLTYTVTDSDGNSATAKQVVLVNDGTYIAGTTYILQAKAFTKRVGQVDTSDAAIKTAASVALYVKATGSVSSETVNIVDDGGYAASVGTYTIQFEVANETTTTKTITASVITGDAPILSAPAFTEINVNGAFNPLTGVSASDTEDGNITGTVQVSGSVNTAVAGVYVLTYAVTDSDGNSATAKQVVLVNDGTYVVGTTYILQVSDFTKRISEVDTAPAAIKAAAGVKVYEKATGSVSSETVNIVDNGGYSATVGSYDIIFDVSSDSLATQTITATVSAGAVPVLTVPAFTEINLNAVFDPLTGVNATDTEDGNLIADVQIDGSVDASVAGVYTLKYSVTDSDNNTVTATQVVLVNDGIFTVGNTFIISAHDFAIGLGSVDTNPAAIKAEAKVKVYEKATGDEVAEPVNIADDGGYSAVLGSYAIQFEVIGDTQATVTIQADVVTGEIPTLTVPHFTEINVNDAFNALTGVSATDIEDGNLINAVVINGSVNTAVAGAYILRYSVTDSDLNTVDATQVVLVNDGTYVAGDNYIIGAKDFTKRVGQVDASDAGIKVAAGVTVFSKNTGIQIFSSTVNVVDDGGYSAIVGSYTIKLQVSSDALATRTIIGTVIAGDSPVLSTPAFTEINVNGAFNPLTGVSASDTEDGNITGAIQVSGSVNTAVAGVYVLNYTVTDSDGNSTTAKQVVLVNDGTYVAGTTYILQASDFTKRVSEVDIAPAAIKTAAGVTVYEKATGSVSSETVNIVDAGGYSATVGSYDITFEVASDSVATQTITATVSPGAVPVLTVPAFTEINVNGAFNPLTGVSASDTEDGNITGSVQVSGSVNTAVAGVYVLTYTVTDSDGNSATAKQVVLVNNGTYVAGTTYILQASNFTKRISEVNTAQAVIKTAAGVKVYEKATGSVSSETVNIVDAGGYSATVGSYDITFEVASDSVATQTITATVVAGDTPILTVPAFTEINVNGAFNALTGVSATDTEDGNLINAVVITGSVNTSTPGVYSLNYSVSDSDGNTATKTQVVLVNDGSYVAGTDYILQAKAFTKRVGQVDTSDAAIKTAASVTLYVKATGSVSSETVNIVDDGGYAASVGTYTIQFEVANETTTTKTITASVITGDAPILSAPAFTEINVNGAFNPLTGVSASDTEDGNITGTVQVSGSVNTAVAGVYVLNYSVSDSDGNSATAKQVVLVNDGKYVAGTTYILQASDFTKLISEVDTAPAAIKTAAGVKVYEKATGSVSSETVNIVDNGGYSAAVGSYDIIFDVASDSVATQTITATVSAGDVPVLTVPAFTEINLNAVFDPLTGVSATDTEDGNLIADVQIDGSVDASMAGVYTIKYSVTDSDNNTVTATQVVLVNDGSFKAGSTFIISAHDFAIGLGQVDTNPAATKAEAKVKVYEKATGDEVVEPVNIADDGGYSAVLGSYNIQFEVISDTQATVTIQADVVTGEIPTLTVPQFTEINVNDAFNDLTGVSATDIEDGNLINVVVINGSVNTAVAGVYTLQYSVTDSDLNTVDATQVVLVNDGTYVAGNSFIIRATDFVKRVGEVDTTQAAIKAAANTNVFSKTTGVQLFSTSVNVIDKGGYNASVGTYNIVIGVGGDALAIRTITANIVAGDSPVLSAPAFTEINVNAAFDPLTGVSASDTEDGNITGAVQVIGSVDTAVAGVYTLQYSVTDSDGNTTTAKQVVLVNDGTYIVGTTYILQASDFTKRISEVNTAPTAIKTAAEVTVYEKATGSASSETVNIVDAGGYSATVGSYDITFEVAGDSLATQTITATVTAGDIPVLTVPGFTELNINEGFNPLTGVSATDTEDGNLINNVIVSGSVNTAVAGVYTLNYSVSDSDGNTVTAKQIVLVNDGDYIVGNTYILKASDFVKTVSQVDTDPAAIKAAAQVKVYEKTTGNETTTLVNIIDDGGYTAIVGLYNIVFEVNGDAQATKTIVATVSIGNRPVLSVPSFTDISLYDSFDPLYEVSASDEEDGDISANIQVNGSVDTNKVGIYLLEYSVTDSDNNTVIKTRTVLVNDGIFVYDNGYIIQAFDFKVGVSKANISNEKMIELAKVKVYAVENQRWIDSPTITVERNNFDDVVGQYPITFTFNPSITITATVYNDRDGLPETGESSSVIGFSGLLLLVAGSTLLFLNKRRNENNN